jgi:hypothetical protein
MAGAGGFVAWHCGSVGTIAPAAGNSVAVLPFDNISGDPQQAYFSVGLAEEVRATLADWVWLAQGRAGGKLVVLETGNADTPLTSTSQRPLAVVDVREHANHIDYRNRRADHVAAVFDKLPGWRFAERNRG